MKHLVYHTNSLWERLHCNTLRCFLVRFSAAEHKLTHFAQTRRVDSITRKTNILYCTTRSLALRHFFFKCALNDDFKGCYKYPCSIYEMLSDNIGVAPSMKQTHCGAGEIRHTVPLYSMFINVSSSRNNKLPLTSAFSEGTLHLPSYKKIPKLSSTGVIISRAGGQGKMQRSASTRNCPGDSLRSRCASPAEYWRNPRLLHCGCRDCSGSSPVVLVVAAAAAADHGLPCAPLRQVPSIGAGAPHGSSVVSGTSQASAWTVRAHVDVDACVNTSARVLDCS